MRVAVVILNWNGREMLRTFLPSVVRFSPNATVYVADNASTDGSVAFVQAHFPSVKIIQNERNGGYAQGYNDALRELDEELLVLLNSDVEVSENWLEPVIRMFTEQADVAACQPKILQHRQKDHFEYAGASGGFIDVLGYPFCRGRMFDTLEADSGQYNDSTEIFWASGACLFARKEAFSEAGGFDTDLFAHMEEIDLCWRLKRMGWRIMAEPHSVVFHVGGGTLSHINPRKTFLNFRNGLEIMVKNLPKAQIAFKLPLRMFLDGLAALKFLVSGDLSHTGAVFRAHLAFYSRLRSTLSKRSGNYHVPLRGVYGRSAVWSYFAGGKKTFSELRKDDFS